jgi:rubrerythrin
MELDETTRQQLLTFQRAEITEHHIYRQLAQVVRPAENQRVLEQIARDELRHYQGWKQYTGQEVKPDRLKMWFYYWVSRILGFTFGVKLMEQGEEAPRRTTGRSRRSSPRPRPF